MTSIGIQLRTTGFVGILDIDKQPDGTFRAYPVDADTHQG